MNERLLKMPRLGETMDEGKIVGWLIKPGDAFGRGDPILEIETDKTIAEFPALGAGRLTEILADLGETIEVGVPIARIEIAAGPDWTAGEGEEAAEAGPAPAVITDGLAEIDLLMPRLGETMEEGRIAKWLKADGESFVRGEAIIEIETDKTIAEFPALTDGRLVRILRTEDETVTVGEPIARILAPAEAHAETPAKTEVPQTPAALPEKTAAVSARRAGERVRATPLARRLARQRGVDIANISGTGRRGRVEKEDVLGFSGADTAPRSSKSAPADVSFAKLGRGRLAYLDSGGSGEAFLLLHGFSGDRTTWASLVSGLKRAGKRVVAPDLPGHGLTEIEAAAPADLAADLPAFLAGLGLARVHVVAHSLGAVAALGLAGLASERIASLTLIAPAGLGREIDGEFVHGMASVRSTGELAHLLRRLSANDGDLSDAALTDLLGQLAGGRLKALADGVAGPYGQRVDIVAPLHRLTASVPVQVIFGLEDRIIPWTQVQSLPPRAAIHLLARAGHMPQWDQAKDVLDIVLSRGGAA